MHPLDNATFVSCTEPPPGATLEGVQIRLLTADPRGASDFPRGPFKLLRGDGMERVRPVSGGAKGHCAQLGGEVDQLLRVEHDSDLGALKRDDDPGDAFFGRIGCLLNADAGRIDFGPAVRALFCTHADQPQAALDRGERRHDQSVRLAFGHAPDSDLGVVETDSGQLTLWNSSEHLAVSLTAPRWSVPISKAAPEREARQ